MPSAGGGARLGRMQNGVPATPPRPEMAGGSSRRGPRRAPVSSAGQCTDSSGVLQQSSSRTAAEGNGFPPGGPPRDPPGGDQGPRGIRQIFRPPPHTGRGGPAHTRSSPAERAATTPTSTDEQRVAAHGAPVRGAAAGTAPPGVRPAGAQPPAGAALAGTQAHAAYAHAVLLQRPGDLRPARPQGVLPPGIGVGAHPGAAYRGAARVLSSPGVHAGHGASSVPRSLSPPSSGAATPSVTSAHSSSNGLPPGVKFVHSTVELLQGQMRREDAPKKKRTRTTPEQLRILQRAFVADPMPNSTARVALAKRLGMNARAVQVWFQNRRAKEKLESRRTSAPAAGQDDAALSTIHSAAIHPAMAAPPALAAFASLAEPVAASAAAIRSYIAAQAARRPVDMAALVGAPYAPAEAPGAAPLPNPNAASFFSAAAAAFEASHAPYAPYALDFFDEAGAPAGPPSVPVSALASPRGSPRRPPGAAAAPDAEFSPGARGPKAAAPGHAAGLGLVFDPASSLANSRAHSPLVLQAVAMLPADEAALLAPAVCGLRAYAGRDSFLPAVPGSLLDDNPVPIPQTRARPRPALPRDSPVKGAAALRLAPALSPTLVQGAASLSSLVHPGAARPATPDDSAPTSEDIQAYLDQMTLPGLG